MCKTFCEYMSPFLLGKYIGVELLGHMVDAHINLSEIRGHFSKIVKLLSLPQHQCVRVPDAPHPCQYLMMSFLFFLALAIVVWVQWYLTANLPICFFFQGSKS